MRCLESWPVRSLIVLVLVWACSKEVSFTAVVPGVDAGAGGLVKGPFQKELEPPEEIAPEPDAAVAEPGPEDAGVASPSGPDAGHPEAGVEDAGAPARDAGVPTNGHDAGTRDAGVRDAGVRDAGAPVDAGVLVTFPVDAGAGVPPNCPALHGTLTAIAAGTWCVTGDVIIPTGVTLEVPPGTTFIFTGRFHFGRDPATPDAEPPLIQGSGSLHAIGTQDKPIVFRGATPSTGWYGIVIDHSSDLVHLEWVTIRDTLKDDPDPNSRIWIRGGGLGSYVNVKGTVVRHCTFTNNHAISVAGALDINSHGQWPNAGPVEITDSLFEDNWSDCARYSFSSTDLCGGGAIRLSHIGGDASLVKIQRNVFRNNRAAKVGTIDAYGGAIGGFDSAVIVGPGNVFQSNHADTGDGALSCSHHASVGTIVSAVDPGVVFSGNTPDNGCGL